MIKNNKYKTVLCRKWNKGKCNYDKNKCLFAHGDNDINKNNIKTKCVNGDKCYNENCLYEHPNEWNPEDNKKDCLFCKKGFCNKKDVKYYHIKEDKYDIYNDNNFPELNKTNKLYVDNKNDDFNNLDFKNKVEDVIINDKESVLYDELLNVKKELYNNYKSLSKLDSWSDSMDIEDNIKLLRDKYNILKEKYKKEDILDDELNFESLEIINVNNKLEDDTKIEIPEVTFTINGINFDNNNENDNIFKIIYDMETYINNCINKIKHILDNKIVEDNKQKDNILNYKLQINQFISALYLLKLNSSDLKINLD